ncbi:MAG: VIT domain-containing protein [Planctomycetota bacterium]|jgi:Ca-activated chloride channel family protein
MKATKVLLALAATTVLTQLAYGQAIVEIRIRRPPREAPVPRPVPIRHNPVYITNHTVNVAITDGAAVTEIDQVFHNPNNRILEGTYIFPLPSEAAVDRFSMFMNGQEVVGEVMEANKARAIYEAIVRKMQDPGLVELIGKKLVRARVFPIPARGDVRVKIQYAQALDQIGGLFEYVYPLNSRRFSKTPLKQVVVGLKIRAKWPIKSVYSPSHRLDVVRKSEREVVASFEGKNLAPGRDFQLFYNLSAKDFGLGVLCHNTPREDGFFMTMIAPKTEFASDEILKKDIVFVADTSGSMRGPKMNQARKALVYCLRGLNPGDRFGVVDFSTEARTYAEGLREANREIVGDAVEYVKNLSARGGTNINAALQEALRLKDKDATGRIFMIVFFTDGEATITPTDPKTILKNVADWNAAKDRIFVFGVGYDVNTAFLDQLAEDNRGSRDYVNPEEDLEVKLSAFADKIAYPVLSDLKLEFQGVKVEDIYPKKLPDLFRGTQLLVFGRYKDAGNATVILRGNITGKKAIFEFPVEFKARERDHAFIPGLWARRKVGYMLDEIRLHGFHKELRDEIVRLGKRYGIVTPYTSFLVTEDTPHPRPVPGPGLRGGGRQPVPSTPSPQADGAPTPSPTPTPGAAKPGSAPSTQGGDTTGRKAVERSKALREMKKAEKEPEEAEDDEKGGKSKKNVKTVAGKSFSRLEGGWVDQDYKSETFKGKTVQVKYMSTEYFTLLKDHPELAPFFALGEKVKVLWEGVLYVVTEQEKTEEKEEKKEKKE